MTWENLALKAAGLILGIPGAGITDSISLADLQAALNDAVEKIETNTKQAILEDNIRAIRADTESLSRMLTEYRRAPQGTDRLEHATASATSLVSNCKNLSIVAPSGPGLAGHPYFLVAVNLNIAVLQERVKVFGEGERLNIIDLLVDSIAHASRMETGWQDWNEARFGNLYWEFTMATSKGWMLTFKYTFDGKVQTIVGFCSIFDTSGWTKLYKTAQAKRLNHIWSEYGKLEDAFVVPSQKIVAKWNSYLKKLKMTTMTVQMAQIKKHVSEARRVGVQSLRRR